MRVLNCEMELVPLDSLRPHPRNPRRGDLGAIRRSIDSNGFYGAVVAQRSSGHIVAGNHRFLAARNSGAQSIPVIWIDVDDDAALRILLADNRTSDQAGYDERLLSDLLKELADAGALDGTGYDVDDVDKLLTKLGDEAREAADQSAELRAEFQILVICRDESQQSSLLAELSERGFACRALIS